MAEEKFELVSNYAPTGDQPQAIAQLVEGVQRGDRCQTLLGVTGSGKTFTMANVIAQCNRPTLVLAHNKTLAAQLCTEFRSFFPNNAVEYFVSYYDYYQPEAYIPSTDTYIEKDSAINDEIDRLRHSATAALSERRDVIIVASVSCIYSLGDPIDYRSMVISLRPGMQMERDELCKKLVTLQYERNDVNFVRNKFRVHGDTVDIYLAYMSELAIRVEFFGDEIDRITEFNPLTGSKQNVVKHVAIFPASHYIVSAEKKAAALEKIRAECDAQVKQFTAEGKLIEAQRIAQRTNYDIEMLNEVGICKGIENYSAVLSGRAPGSMPTTLLDYFPKDFLLFVDESHVTLPQVRAMYGGDYARKKTLVEYGFRLPSAFDNRPLKFEECGVQAQPDDLCLRHPRRVRAPEQHTGGAAGHPSHGSVGSGHLGAPGGRAGGGSSGRDQRPHPAAGAGTGDHPDQKNGRGSYRLPHRAGDQGQVYAPRGGYLRAHGDHQGSALGQHRCGGGHQPAA